jgi:hypothetical protein
LESRGGDAVQLIVDERNQQAERIPIPSAQRLEESGHLVRGRRRRHLSSLKSCDEPRLECEARL